MSTAADPTPGPSLVLPGLEALEPPIAEQTPPGASPPAPEHPVARVAVDTRVPHLDRLFDYRVPARLHELARPGTRVRVSFHGRVQVAWLVERVATTQATVALQEIREVVSPIPALTPETWALVRAVAARSAGLDADVLRQAIPPRAARTEQAFLRENDPEETAPPPDFTVPPAQDAAPADADPEDAPTTAASAAGPTPPGSGELTGWAPYRGGSAFLEALAEPSWPQGPPRAVCAVAPSAPSDWADLIVTACLHALAAGRRAVVVVPDHARLDRLEAALAPHLDAERVARLSNEEGQSARCEAFLRALTGRAWVVIGTRSAAFAPVPRLGLLACFDDGDPNLTERQAPYWHARDVLLLRSQQQDCPLLLTGYAVSAEAQRLVGTGWAAPLAMDRPALRSASPRVSSSEDSWQRTRDPLAALARIPGSAYRAAREALEHGPVLIQVARTGYAPSLSCQRCRASVRCPHCHGPLALTQDSRAQAVCRWCHRGVSDWSCPECGNRTWRLSTVGALRTAEELGRAFPQVPVVSSSADHVRAEVPARPGIVVATPGAEPRVRGGYRAALLLDGDRMLQRDSLRNTESVLRRWFNAGALVAPRERGGTVVVTAGGNPAVDALVRWDPAGFARRELAERQELGLPPAVRTAALTGPRTAVEAFLAALDAPGLAPEPALRVIDPVPLEEHGEDGEEPDYRAILFMSYAVAPTVTAALRSVRASASAARTHAPVQIRCDGSDVL